MIDWLRHNRNSDWTKVNACVVGLGVAGFAAADALIEMGANVSIIDQGSGEIQQEHATVLEILGAKTYLNYHRGNSCSNKSFSSFTRSQT